MGLEPWPAADGSVASVASVVREQLLKDAVLRAVARHRVPGARIGRALDGGAAVAIGSGLIHAEGDAHARAAVFRVRLAIGGRGALTAAGAAAAGAAAAAPRPAAAASAASTGRSAAAGGRVVPEAGGARRAA